MMHTDKGTHWRVALLFLILFAFALRLVALERQPLWWDEGLNTYFANLSPGEVVSEMIATNHADPPLYPFALVGWRALVGPSPLALRLLSALLGVVAVALTWAIGRWLAGRPAAGLAAMLVALSPMQVYYGREAKGYLLGLVCALLSTYLWGRKLGFVTPAGREGKAERVPLGWWILYALLTAAAIGTHYYLALLVAAQGVWTVIVSWRDRRVPLRWLLAVTLAGALLLPWVLAVYETTVRGVTGVSITQPLSIGRFLGWLALAFGAGVDQPELLALVGAMLVTTLALIGWVRSPRRGFYACWIGVPLLLAFLIQVGFSFFFPRFLLYLGPAVYLLAAEGATSIRGRHSRAVSTAVLLVLVGVWGGLLARQFARPVDLAEDPRSAVDFIRAVERPDDGLVYVYIWQVGYVFSYDPDTTLDVYRAYFTPESVGDELAAILQQHPRLWLMDYQIGADDPANLSAGWLKSNAYQVETKWFGRHHLALYLAPDYQTPGVGPAVGQVDLEDAISLDYPLVEAQLQPGDALALPLRWRFAESVADGYHIFIHLGMPGQPPLAQYDGPLLKDGLPGDERIDRRALLLPDDVPPGSYQVMVGLYDPTDGRRLSLAGAGDVDVVSLGTVHVAGKEP